MYSKDPYSEVVYDRDINQQNVQPGVQPTEVAKIAGKVGMSTLAGLVIGAYLIYTVLIKR